MGFKMLKKEFEFILQDELIYSHGADAKIVAKRLLLRAPNTRLLSMASKLSSIVMAGFIAADKNRKAETEEERRIREENEKKNILLGAKKDDSVDAETLFMIISGSIDQNQMNIFINTFQELFLSDGICLIDGKVSLTQPLLDSIDSRETLRLMGEYIANFLLPSGMNNSKKKN
jgi:hypothetical protein